MTDSKNKNPEQLLTSELLKMTDKELFDFLQKQNFKTSKETKEFIEKHLPERDPNGIFPVKKQRRTNVQKSDDLIYQPYKSNKHALSIMTGKVIAVENVKESYSRGDEDEASEYLRGYFSLWNNHPKAFGWILQFMATLKR